MDLNNRIRSLEKKLQIQFALNCTLLVVFLCSLLFSFTSKNTTSSLVDKSIIRAYGIIIVDSSGKDRILIGAPIPNSKNRIRTDLKKVKSNWADINFRGSKYMEYYKEYIHSTNGILFLDSNGYDRIVIGDPVSDPNIGKRIGPSTGIVINDEKGFERTGYGILKVPGGNRIVLGLDGDNGSEAAALGVYENGEAGISIYGSKDRHSIFLGRSPINSQIDRELNGLILWNDTVPNKIFNSHDNK